MNIIYKLIKGGEKNESFIFVFNCDTNHVSASAVYYLAWI